MARGCTICDHPKRAKIDDAIRAALLSKAEIGRQFNVSARAVGRHDSSGHIATGTGEGSARFVPVEEPTVPIVPALTSMPLIGNMKRTPAQRDFDLSWIVERSEEGLNSKEIGEEARRIGRETVGGISDEQIRQDLRKARRMSLVQAVDKDRAMLDRALGELARIAFADLRDVLEWGPDGVSLKRSLELHEDGAALVSGVTFKVRRERGKGLADETTEVVDFKIETHGKVPALQAIVRHLAPVEVKIVDDRDTLLERAAEGLGVDPAVISAALVGTKD